LAGTNSPVAHIDPSHSSPSPGSGDRTETFQRPAEAPAVLQVAAATVPAAATLEQLEKEELDDKMPDFTRRGGLRCLGQYYATQLNRRTMAHLRAELKVDGELRQQFQKLLAKDAVDWKAWEMTKWYDTKQYEFVPGQLGRPVGVSLASFQMFQRAWKNHVWQPTLSTFPDSDESDDDYDEQHHGNYA
jgi:hypothetical protein